MRAVFRDLDGHAGRRYIDDYDSLFKIPFPQRYERVLEYLHTPVRITDNVTIFGHFFPVKYLGEVNSSSASKPFLATFLRDPLERLASHYAYWKKERYTEHYLWKIMLDEAWSFEKFALSPQMQNFYAQYMIQVPLSRFDFIGVHERLPAGWSKFLKVAGLPDRALTHINQSHSQEVLSRISPETRSEIMDFHAKDYFIYRYAAMRS